jgi:hypothetical protein
MRHLKESLLRNSILGTPIDLWPLPLCRPFIIPHVYKSSSEPCNHRVTQFTPDTRKPRSSVSPHINLHSRPSRHFRALTFQELQRCHSRGVRHATDRPTVKGNAITEKAQDCPTIRRLFCLWTVDWVRGVCDRWFLTSHWLIPLF